jgi:hypothetical protein
LSHLKPAEGSLRLLTLFYSSALLAKTSTAGVITAAAMLTNPKYAAPTSATEWEGHIKAVGAAALSAMNSCKMSTAQASAVVGSFDNGNGTRRLTFMTIQDGRHLLAMSGWEKALLFGAGAALTVGIIMATGGVGAVAIEAAAELAPIAAEALGFAEEAEVVGELAVGVMEYVINYELPGKIVDFYADNLLDNQEQKDVFKLGASLTAAVNDLKGLAKTADSAAIDWSGQDFAKFFADGVVYSRDAYDAYSGFKKDTPSSVDNGHAQRRAPVEVDAFAPDALDQADAYLHRRNPSTTSTTTTPGPQTPYSSGFNPSLTGGCAALLGWCRPYVAASTTASVQHCHMYTPLAHDKCSSHSEACNTALTLTDGECMHAC